MTKNFLFSAFIEYSSIFIALIYTLNIRLNIKLILAIIGCIILPSSFVYLFLVDWLGIIILFLFTGVFFYIISKNIRTLLDICTIFFIGMLADQLTQLLENSLIPKGIMYLPLHYALFIIFFSIFVYGYKQIIIMKMWARLDIPLIAQVSIFLISSITVIVLYLNVFIPGNKDAIELVKINLAIQIGYFLLMLFLFALLLYNIKKENQVKQNMIENEQFKMYVEELEHVNRDMQKFRHDYANILLTMKGYLDNNNLDDLKKYFEQHILKTEANASFNNKVLGNLENLKLLGLKGLIATKALQADELGIKISIEIPETINSIYMNIIDLTRIMGILIDNSIEANKLVESGVINLAFFKTRTDSIIIIIRNTMGEEITNLKDIYNESFSTKGKDRGIGLSNVKYILERYPQVIMNTRIEDEWFIQEIEIPFRGR
ncbi:sensor histidine kinase [Rummeliibacillus pycnus]|uniref:sensor histidine kinase n=1 Tax=Rummeliibacillus pycnus TaxID=101070 RepID=UPI0037CBDEDC